MSEPETLVLVDGSSYLFRAYHALPPLTNRAGEPTGAMIGVLNMLSKLQEDYVPDYFAVVFDTKGKTFRHEAYPAYKANRPSMPEELGCQIEPLHAMIRAQGIPLLLQVGVEADDIIATLAIQAEQAGLRVVISSSDKDLAQLVSPQVILANTMQGVELDEAGVEKKFGVPPALIGDYLALMGDSSDNIPGVPKVGPKTAAKWLHTYGSLEAILAQADSIKGKVGDNLRASCEQLPLSRELVQLRSDVALSVTPQDLQVAAQDTTVLKEYYQRFEFKRLLAEIDGSDVTSEALPLTTEIVSTPQALQTWAGRLEKAERWAFALHGEDAVAGIALAVAPGEVAYIPLQHAGEHLTQETVWQALKPHFENAQSIKLGHDLKPAINALNALGIAVNGVLYDVMLLSHLLTGSVTRHDRVTLAQRYLQRDLPDEADLVGSGAKKIAFAEVDVSIAADYAAKHIDAVFCGQPVLWSQCNPVQQRIYETVDAPVLQVLAAMEQRGILIDVAQLNQQSERLAQQLAALTESIHALAGEPFNINSTKQLREILFEKLNLPVLSKTAKGVPSTAESVLYDLALDYPLPKLLLEYRKLNKLKSTYVDRLPEYINPATGRVHTVFHQAVTSTGRLSSSDPNLQNIPIRSEEGALVRAAFIAPKGYEIITVDYSQVELRIMAELSQDEGLLSAFAANQDIHCQTAAEIFSVALDAVTALQRRQAKAINFGLIYGMSAFGLAKQLDMTTEQAQHYMTRYFERYPKVADYMQQVREQALAQGYVETLLGRRVYLPEAQSKHAGRRRAAERAAINAPMQGTAADIIKKAMIAVEHALAKAQLDAKMLLQVHDELVLESAIGARAAVTHCVSECMMAAATLSVPLEVSAGYGPHWQAAH